MIMPGTASYIVEPVEWLKRHDHDMEMHSTVASLIAQGRIAELVLMLETYIGATAAVRAKVAGWDGVWDQAVREMQAFRSLAQARTVAHLLATTVSEGPS